MITNYFLLAAGLLSIAFSFGHAAWGQKNIMAEVAGSGIQNLTKHAIFTNLHQGTSFMFIAGITLIIASTLTNTLVAQSLASLVVAINFGNFVVFLGASLVKNRQALGQTIPQLFIMVAYLGLIIAGILRP